MAEMGLTLVYPVHCTPMKEKMKQRKGASLIFM
jgi:metal-dependent hydrolase (beta-lactamase superfamily II)